MDIETATTSEIVAELSKRFDCVVVILERQHKTRGEKNNFAPFTSGPIHQCLGMIHSTERILDEQIMLALARARNDPDSRGEF